MGDFIPILTEDGTPSLHHRPLGEACHARQGARREAALKFAAPALGHLGEPPAGGLKVLDACFGLGYNSFEFLSQGVLRETPIKIYAVEKASEVWSYLPQVKSVYPQWQDQINRLAHGFYASRGPHQMEPFSMDLESLLDPQQHLSRTLQEEGPIHLVFHDAFSSGKMPELWTVELMRAYFNILAPGGAVFTYSSAHPVCAAFIEAGFSLYRTAAVDRRQGGLRAVKPMDGEIAEMDGDLADLHQKTTARVPYRWLESGPSRRERIVLAWEAEKKAAVASGALTIKQYGRAFPVREKGPGHTPGRGPW